MTNDTLIYTHFIAALPVHRRAEDTFISLSLSSVKKLHLGGQRAKLVH